MFDLKAVAKLAASSSGACHFFMNRIHSAKYKALNKKLSHFAELRLKHAYY